MTILNWRSNHTKSHLVTQMRHVWSSFELFNSGDFSFTLNVQWMINPSHPFLLLLRFIRNILLLWCEHNVKMNVDTFNIDNLINFYFTHFSLLSQRQVARQSLHSSERIRTENKNKAPLLTVYIFITGSGAPSQNNVWTQSTQWPPSSECLAPQRCHRSGWGCPKLHCPQPFNKRVENRILHQCHDHVCKSINMEM